MAVRGILAEDDDQRFFRQHCLAEVRVAAASSSCGQIRDSRRRSDRRTALACRSSLICLCIRHVEAGAVQAHVGAQRPCKQRMLVGWIAADEQDRRRRADLAQACGFAGVSRQRAGKRRIIGRALDDRCCWCPEPCAQTSAAGNSLRSWCGWSRSRRWPSRRACREFP